MKIKSRDRLWYDKFEYCVKFNTLNLPGIRNLSHVSLNQYMDTVYHFERVKNYGGSWHQKGLQEEKQKENIDKNLHQLIDFFTNLDSQYKLQISYNNDGHFYTNNKQDIDALENFYFVKILEQKRCVIDIPRNSIIFKKAKHNLRTYFKNQRITTDQKHNLKSFLSSQTQIRLSPSFVEFFDRYPNYHYIADNYFIDYNDLHFLTMLSIIAPMKIRKTVTLLRDK